MLQILHVRKTEGNINEILAADPKVRKAGGDFDMASDIYKGATHFGKGLRIEAFTPNRDEKRAPSLQRILT